MLLQAETFETPCGPFSAAVNASGAIVATAFGNVARLAERLPEGVHLIAGQGPALLRLKDELDAYFSNKLRAFSLPLAPLGTPFQKRVWSALASIPFGETRGYGELAAEIGKPGAARAIGRANATNPVCLLVPCHRVIGADGSLTGFAFGEDIKRQLLAHEGAL